MSGLLDLYFCIFRVLANYMMWSVVSNSLGTLPIEVTKSVLILDRIERGTKELDPIDERCVDKTNAVFGFGTGALYVEKYFPESSKKTVILVFSIIPLKARPHFLPLLLFRVQC